LSGAGAAIFRSRRERAGAQLRRRASEADFIAAVERLRAGNVPADALDDRFVAAFAIAGTSQDCLAQARQYFEAGASELVLSFAGAHPEADMKSLGEALP
jgi:alkanesulfonate monooxygenase SsuD/methylene tetrahydromethanopterin reductase-like flavin-dependent oxidoreductase (luciferase family)